ARRGIRDRDPAVLRGGGLRRGFHARAAGAGRAAARTDRAAARRLSARRHRCRWIAGVAACGPAAWRSRAAPCVRSGARAAWAWPGWRIAQEFRGARTIGLARLRLRTGPPARECTMRRTLLLLLAALSFAVPASGPARAGEPQVQALVVDAPSERPGYRMRAVALKNLGERSIRVAPGQRLMAPRREPDTCGAVGPRDRTSRLGAGKTMLVPVFLYAEGEAPQ